MLDMSLTPMRRNMAAQVSEVLQPDDWFTEADCY